MLDQERLRTVMSVRISLKSIGGDVAIPVNAHLSWTVEDLRQRIPRADSWNSHRLDFMHGNTLLEDGMTLGSLGVDNGSCIVVVVSAAQDQQVLWNDGWENPVNMAYLGATMMGHLDGVL